MLIVRVLLAVVLLGFLIHIIVRLSSEFARKPSLMTRNKLIDKTLYHFTSSDRLTEKDYVLLKQTSRLTKNNSTLFRPAVYFFVDEPTPKQVSDQNIRSHEILVAVPFKNLQPEYVRYIPKTNVVAYLAPYEGQGQAVEWRHSLLEVRRNRSVVVGVLMALATMLAYCIGPSIVFGNVDYLFVSARIVFVVLVSVMGFFLIGPVVMQWKLKRSGKWVDV